MQSVDGHRRLERLRTRVRTTTERALGGVAVPLLDAHRIVDVDATNVAPLGLEEALVTGPARYLSWGWLSISVTNLIVISVMIALFLLAVLLPFVRDRHKS